MIVDFLKNKFMHCPKYNNQIDDSSKFCKECESNVFPFLKERNIISFLKIRKDFFAASCNTVMDVVLNREVKKRFCRTGVRRSIWTGKERQTSVWLLKPNRS